MNMYIEEGTYLKWTAGFGIKMTVSIKSRVRAVGRHPSGEGGAWRGQMKCDLIRRATTDPTFIRILCSHQEKQRTQLIRTAKKSYVLFRRSVRKTFTAVI